MAKKAVTIQERLEKLIAGAGANADGPALNKAQLTAHVEALNRLEYQVIQAKQALSAAVKARDERLKQATDDAIKAEYTVKAHFGPRAAKLKDYILPGTPATRAAKPKA